MRPHSGSAVLFSTERPLRRMDPQAVFCETIEKRSPAIALSCELDVCSWCVAFQSLQDSLETSFLVRVPAGVDEIMVGDCCDHVANGKVALFRSVLKTEGWRCYQSRTGR